jgi:hypothetical protein
MRNIVILCIIICFTIIEVTYATEKRCKFFTDTKRNLDDCKKSQNENPKLDCSVHQENFDKFPNGFCPGDN